MAEACRLALGCLHLIKENAIMQRILGFIDIKGHSLVPLSGQDVLVIHLFRADPAKKAFPYIIIMDQHGRKKAYNVEGGENEGRHHSVHLPLLTLGPLGPGSPCLPCGPWGPWEIITQIGETPFPILD